MKDRTCLFAVFVFDWGAEKMLLCRRKFSNLYSDGLWESAIYSHLQKEENIEQALNDRMILELGLEEAVHIVDPKNYGLLLDGGDVIYNCGTFQCFSSYGGQDGELKDVFLYSPDYNGFSPSDFKYDSNVIEETKWVSIKQLEEWMERTPEEFAVWFKTAFEVAYDILCAQAHHRDMFWIMGGQS